ncbi:hypothetical protein ACFWXK_30115 [Streptomyces sp. NPDC059070]|uniref:hypothetical protein n=1 Tax=unclassified Streptomyces TaxID=2593676 RepID=UPI0034E2969A
MWGHGGTYQAWTDYLGRWARGESVAGLALPPLGRDDYHQDTWVRLTNQLTTALGRRLQDWADALVRALSAEADEFAAARALVQARSGLRAVRELAGHPSLTPELRTRLLQAVDGQVADLTRQLEGQLDRLARTGADPRWIEARRRTLRDNPLTGGAAPGAGPKEGAPVAPAPDPWAYDPTAAPRRRIITD